MVSRITLPSFAGVRPRSDFWMAFSIFVMRALVPRLDHQRPRVGHRDVATWLSGVGVP